VVTAIAGISVGHWTDHDARTGCTVVILPPGTVASGEVRGGAPATREFALLHPENLVAHVDAVVMSGGSAFGLAAADGVMTALEEMERGHETKHGRVPIVVGMSLYDLGVGDALVRPDASKGYLAAMSASSTTVASGAIGAGCGATTGKWSGGAPDVGGLGLATVRSGDLIVSALIAVNAFGSIDDGTSTADLGPPAKPAVSENTTIGIIATNAVADKSLCQLLAQSGHDGMARALRPAHTSVDGDALVAVATQEVEADPFHLRLLAQDAVTLAIRCLKSG
jgi:L-aminopeptidase/D-esterase-like protein